MRNAFFGCGSFQSIIASVSSFSVAYSWELVGLPAGYLSSALISLGLVGGVSGELLILFSNQNTVILRCWKSEGKPAWIEATGPIDGITAQKMGGGMMLSERGCAS
ncbi:hypothetical protein V8F20_008434 [Naviculisporaceae sp. PSN 640]